MDKSRGKPKGTVTQYDTDREMVTYSILKEVFLADRDTEYSVRELHNITGLPISTISKWLDSNNNVLAFETKTKGHWKWHAPVAHDIPLTVEEHGEVDKWYRDNPNMKQKRPF